jgi:hypothetical protein
MGAAMPNHGPQQMGFAVPSRARGVVERGHAPLWQYFARLQRQTSPLLPLKHADPGLYGFFPANPAFVGAAKGA